MHPSYMAARVAGLWYLSMALTGPFTLIYIPSRLIVRGNAAATASKILEHQTMFRLGIAAELVGAVLFIGTAVALYRLFSGVSQTRAMQMVNFAAASAGVAFFNALTHPPSP